MPQMRGELFRVIHGGSGVIFKGSGWYVTDYGKGKSSVTVEGNKPATKSKNENNNKKKNDSKEK